MSVQTETRPSPNKRLERRAERARRIREPRTDRIFLFCVYLLLGVFLLVVLLPLLYIVASSFSSPEAVSAGRVLFWPVDFSLRGYHAVFENPQIVQGYVNSLFYTVVGTIVSVTMTIAIAYPMSRRTLVGRNVVMTAIPDELVEAAELDGCGDLRFLWSVVIPLAKPMIAVVALMYAIMQWNSYFDALIYLKNPDLFPLQLVLRNILILNTTGGGAVDASVMLQRQQLADLLKYSLIVVASVPVLLIYPFVARYFTKGILIGAVKG